MHGKASLLQPLIASIRTALQHVKTAAEQFKPADTWAIRLRHVCSRIVPALQPFPPTPRLLGNLPFLG